MREKTKYIRKNLIHARKKQSLTQTEIADALNISVRQYQSLEAGTSDGSIKVWCKLKEILGVETIDFLLAQEVDNPPDGNPAEKNNS